MENLNTLDYIETLKLSCYNRLKDLEGAPGVEFQEVVLLMVLNSKKIQIPESLRFKDIEIEDNGQEPDQEKSYDVSDKNPGLITAPNNFTI